MDGAVLTFVINKLSDLLERRVALIAGAEDEIRSLRDKLRMLTIFIDIINEPGDRPAPLVQELVRQLQHVSCDAEDVVDKYLSDVARPERKKIFFKKFFTGCSKLSRKGRFSAQAKDIKLTIDSILEEKGRYGVTLDYGSSSDKLTQQSGESEIRERRRNVEEENVVGFDQQFREVMDMLTPKGEVELRVVSIIGMGGLGKTTLARKIFNCEEIRFHFRNRAWVVVSEHVEAKHVLKNILKYLNVNIENDDDDDYLKGRLKEQLDGSKYLIVLDDLWAPKQWEELKSYLPPDQKKSSRILLTSRIENVAYAASPASTIYHLKPLAEADSWILFCKKALKGKECPSNLESTGKEIVSKCKGLPLAIVVLGGSLSAAEVKPSFRYWSKILGDTSWHPDADNDCSKILSLSYRNLPPHLKRCFLYVGVFPEDFEILALDLCLLWVAEGFVNPQSRELEENVAEEYLIDLADRNLIMISKRKSDGRIKSCRIHDLLRDLCMKEAERCNLYEVGAVGAYINVKERIRRLTLHGSDLNTPLEPTLHKGMRSLLEFSTRYYSCLRPEIKYLSVIRVLHFHMIDYDPNIASAIMRNLILLRYMKVHLIDIVPHRTSVINIPHSSMTSNLQVLNLSGKRMMHLPKCIWKLKRLRHLYLRTEGTMPAGSSDDSLPHLQTLSRIVYEEHTSRMLCIRRFPNLRKLALGVHSEHPLRTESLQSLHGLHLASFKIRCCTLSLDSKGRISPAGPLNAVAFPSALTKIHLSNTALKSDHWRKLGELRNLQVLKISAWIINISYEEGIFLTEPLVFKAEAFPQLLHLKLKTGHRNLIVEDRALRTLEYLAVGFRNHYGLNKSPLPEELWLLPTLREIKVIYPSNSMLQYIQSLDLSKRRKVTIAGIKR